MSETAATLTVQRRPALWRDRGRSYELVLDDAVVARLRHGEAHTQTIRPGYHSLQLRIGRRWGSAEVNLNVKPGEQLRFECGPATYSVVRMVPNPYLTLDRTDA